MKISPSNWKKYVYIAKRTSVTKDSYGHQTPVYDTPIKYLLNVQPISEQTRIELFGANSKKMYRAMALSTELDINELDVVYLDDATPTNEVKNGFNSNYVVRSVEKQNIATTYFFESIKG